MPVNQYVYFALSSYGTSATEITAILGLEPDEVTVRGSRVATPRPIPAAHRWKIVCREPGLRVDEQISRILQRLAPHAEAIATLAHRLDTDDREGPSASLQVVRYFNHEHDQQDSLAGVGAQAEAPNLFGWHLGRDVLHFLHRIGAVLDVDEYDMTPDYADE